MTFFRRCGWAPPSVLSSMETQSLPHNYLYSLLHRRKAEGYDWELRPLHRRFYIFQNQIWTFWQSKTNFDHHVFMLESEEKLMDSDKYFFYSDPVRIRIRNTAFAKGCQGAFRPVCRSTHNFLGCPTTEKCLFFVHFCIIWRKKSGNFPKFSDIKLLLSFWYEF